MRYLIFAFVAAVAIWYFFFRSDSTPPPAPVASVQVSPEQQFQTLLSGEVVDGNQLAALCAQYPQLGARILNGRQVRIKGTVAEVRTSGMEGRRADVLLDGSGACRIVLVCDLDQYSAAGVNFRYLGKFEAVGTELLYLLQRKNVLTKKAVITQGTEISQFSELKTLGASRIEFLMVNGPSWAGAQTNETQ